MNEDKPDIDPLFLGMTRPPTTMGVPLVYFGFNFIVTGVGLIAFLDIGAKLMVFAGLSLPLHVIGYLATEKDPHWMHVWSTSLLKTPPIRNRMFWRSNSYTA